jgi:protein-L-isoaspartate(D-aspartate) O-methyltransferase
MSNDRERYFARSMEEARAAMVESLRRAIKDERVLAAFGKVPRELFVLPERQAEAYDNRALPIGHGQTISQPLMVALMLQELALQGTEKVLDIGTGSGYQAALLSELAASVVGVELVPELTERARRVLRENGYDNVTVHQAGSELGWPADGPYDAIVVAAASPRVPQSLLAQLAPGGRMVIPVGERTGQELIVVEKRPEGPTVTRKGACAFVPLVGREAFSG